MRITADTQKVSTFTNFEGILENKRVDLDSLVKQLYDEDEIEAAELVAEAKDTLGRAKFALGGDEIPFSPPALEQNSS